MQITVRAHHLAVTKALKEYAQKKMTKLLKYSDKIKEIVVELNVNDTADEKKRQVAQVTVKVPNNIVRAEEASKDMYASLDVVCDKLEKQLKKYKDKITERKSVVTKRDLSVAPVAPKAKKPSAKAGPVEKLYIAKPMEVEDAEAILQGSGQPFLVFRNISSGEINVLHPLKNGDYGLIET